MRYESTLFNNENRNGYKDKIMISDKFFIETARLLSKESKCCSLQVGALIVKDNRIISMGYNGTVAGTPNCNELVGKEFNREKHSKWSDSHEIHAEMNALMYACQNGISTDGATLYCTHEPCDHCLKNIIQSGIKRIVFEFPYDPSRCASKYRSDDFIKIEMFGELH